jgi:hypothetical protein
LLLGRAYRRAFPHEMQEGLPRPVREALATGNAAIQQLSKLRSDDALQQLSDVRQAIADTRQHLVQASQSDQDLLLDLAELCCTHRYHFAHLKVDKDSRLVVSRTITRPVERRPPNEQSALQRANTWLRHVLGLRPFVVSLPHDQLLWTPSYHLKVKAPANTHVHVIRPVVGERLPRGELEREIRVGRLQWTGLGTDRAHIYMRDAKQWTALRERPLVAAELTFYEDLPGSLLTALIPSVILSTIGMLVLYRFTSVFPQHASHLSTGSAIDLSSAFPAFLIALPGLATVWLARASTSSEPPRFSLLGALGPYVTGILSFGFAILFLFFRVAPLPRHPAIRFSAWASISSLCALWALFVFWRLIAKIRTEVPTCVRH